MLERLAVFLLLPPLALPVAAQDEDADWDVDAAHGPTRTVAFTTDEGTWLNVDVSPDGRAIVFDLLGDLYLFGRKHFTSTRALGAGEVWMYHIAGGDGLQLTERRNDQQDQGNEVAVSPDGQYVYFTEDATGRSFLSTIRTRTPGSIASAGSTARRARSRRSSPTAGSTRPRRWIRSGPKPCRVRRSGSSARGRATARCGVRAPGTQRRARAARTEPRW